MARHHAPLTPSSALLRRLEGFVGVGLQHLASRLEVAHLEVAVGALGSRARAATLTLSEGRITATGRGPGIEALLATGAWLPIPDPFEPEEGLPIAAARATPQTLGEADLQDLGVLIHAARVDHLGALLADHPEERPGGAGDGLRRSSRPWVHDLLSALPGLLGVDHSAGLLLPDMEAVQDGGRAPRYVLAAERLFVEEGETRLPEHLTGLLIPCGEGQGGLLEATLDHWRQDPELPYKLYLPEDDEGLRWSTLGDDDATISVRFATSASRPTERMLLLLPLPLPGRLPGFLSLSWREAAPLTQAADRLLHALRARFTDALAHSDLFRLAADRLELLGCLPAALTDGQCRDRRDFIARLTPLLYESLGAASVAVGVLERGADQIERLVFPNPQGWDLDQPREIPFHSADSLAALSIRLDRPLVLAGGRPAAPDAPALRWNNALMVHERDGLIEDARMELRDYRAEPGWRPLSDCYKPTAGTPIYVGMAVPIRMGGVPVGVIGLDFDRSAPWEAYSGYGAARLYQALARLIASHLALLPSDPAPTDASDS